MVQKLSDWVTETVTAEWENWVDAHSPNARMVLRSLLPSLLYKSLLYALNKRDVISNMRSLLWGLGVDILGICPGIHAAQISGALGPILISGVLGPEDIGGYPGHMILARNPSPLMPQHFEWNPSETPFLSWCFK